MLKKPQILKREVGCDSELYNSAKNIAFLACTVICIVYPTSPTTVYKQ